MSDFAEMFESLNRMLFNTHREPTAYAALLEMAEEEERQLVRERAWAEVARKVPDSSANGGI